MLLALAFLFAGVYLEADAKVNGRILDVNIRFVNEGGPFYLEFHSPKLYDLDLEPGNLRWSDGRVFHRGRARRAMGPGVWHLRERWILPPTIQPGDYKLRVWFNNATGPKLETTIPITIRAPR
jgi:hypothetical protein